MKTHFLILIVLQSALLACSEESGNELQNDRQSPVFEEIRRPLTQGDEDVVKVRGEYMELISEDESEVRIEGRLTDNVGLSQLRIDMHSSNDGHTHARTQSLPGLRIDEVIGLNGATTYDIARIINHHERAFRTGPYHILLHAVDEAGNNTSLADNSSVVRSVYLEREYSPLISLSGDTQARVRDMSMPAGQALQIDGYLEQKRAGRDFSITFIRISLVQDTDRDETTTWDADKSFEAVWGESLFLRDNTGALLSGEPLPAFENNILSLETLLSQVNHNLSAADDGRVLRIEVEDSGANLAVREIKLEVL
ncbi:MAG: DUF4625 domain-containing protein [Cyclobacteriaceae bacterium]